MHYGFLCSNKQSADLQLQKYCLVEDIFKDFRNVLYSEFYVLHLCIIFSLLH